MPMINQVINKASGAGQLNRPIAAAIKANAKVISKPGIKWSAMICDNECCLTFIFVGVSIFVTMFPPCIYIRSDANNLSTIEEAAPANI